MSFGVLRHLVEFVQIKQDMLRLNLANVGGQRLTERIGFATGETFRQAAAKMVDGRAQLFGHFAKPGGQFFAALWNSIINQPVLRLIQEIRQEQITVTRPGIKNNHFFALGQRPERLK